MNKPLDHGNLFADEKVLAAADASVTLPSGIAPEAEPDELDDPSYWATCDSVILHDQPATAIYFNRERSLVIRQERSWDRDEDTYVFIAKENQQAFLDKLCDVLGIGSAP